MRKVSECFLKEVAVTADMTLELKVNMSKGSGFPKKADFESYLDDLFKILPFDAQNEIVGEKMMADYEPSFTRKGPIKFRKDDTYAYFTINIDAKNMPMTVSAEMDSYQGFLGSVIRDKINVVHSLDGYPVITSAFRNIYRNFGNDLPGIESVSVKFDNVDGTVLEPNYISSMNSLYMPRLLDESIQKVEKDCMGIKIDDGMGLMKSLFDYKNVYWKKMHDLKQPVDFQTGSTERRLNFLMFDAKDVFAYPHERPKEYVHNMRECMIGMLVEGGRTPSQVRELGDEILNTAVNNAFGTSVHRESNIDRDPSRDSSSSRERALALDLKTNGFLFEPDRSFLDDDIESDIDIVD